MARLAGGEGEVGGNEEKIEPHPLVLVARREMVGGGRSKADRVAVAEGIDGGGCSGEIWSTRTSP